MSEQTADEYMESLGVPAVLRDDEGEPLTKNAVRDADIRHGGPRSGSFSKRFYRLFPEFANTRVEHGDPVNPRLNEGGSCTGSAFLTRA